MHYYASYCNGLKAKYNRLKQKIERAIQNGRFYRYTKKRQQQLLCRLQHYYQRLIRGGKELIPFAIAGLTLGSPQWTKAQSFTSVTGSANPFAILDIDPNAPFGLNDVGQRSTPSFVDIDGDGDLDAFVGARNGKIRYFENTGDTSSPTFIRSTSSEPFGLIDVGSDAAPDFVDIDGDGDFDTFIGENNGNINFFENTGNATSPAFSLESTNGAFGLTDVGEYAAPSFIDIDDDGDFDVFVGEYEYGNINYFRNTGNATSPAFTLESTDGAFGLTIASPFGIYNAKPSFVDIDGDGDFDAFVGEEDGIINYRENTGSKSSPAFTFVVRTGLFGARDFDSDTAPSFVDIDGDGDFDAFVGERDGNINYLENTGSPSSPALTDPVVDLGNDTTPSFADIDGDGDLDAFVGEEDGTTNYFENTGDATTPIFILSNISEPFGLSDVGEDSKPTFVDIDNDGDFDAFIGETDGNINFFENTGNATSPAFSLESTNGAFGLTNVGFYAAPSFIDIDNDGDFDAFIGETDGNINFFENTGNAASPAFTRSGGSTPFGLTNVGNFSTPNFIDIDNDGDFDAFVGESIGNTNYFENTGNAASPAFSLESTNGAFRLTDVGVVSTPSFADIDNDGDLDAFIGEADGIINFFKNNTAEEQASILVQTITTNTSVSCQNFTTTFVTVNLGDTNNGCDGNGNAIYTTSVSPAGQGVSAAIVGTGMNDCEFTVEIITDANAVIGNYSINLAIEDPDGVTNNSSISGISNSAGTFLSLNLGVLEINTCGIVVNDILANNDSACQDENTLFRTVTLATDDCDLNGNAIYTASVVPAGQGVSAAVIGTGANDCEFVVEISTTADAIPDTYSINLFVGDLGGVTNTSTTTALADLTGTAITFNLGTFNVLGELEITNISGGAVASNFSNEFAVNILNTDANTTYEWMVAGTALNIMIGDGDNTGSNLSIDVGNGNFIEASATTLNVTDNVTRSILTIDNPLDTDPQLFDVQLVTTNPCGTDTASRSNITAMFVPLTRFEVEAFTHYTVLMWETATGIENGLFFVERSYDGKTFEKITQLSSTEASGNNQHYEFIDHTVNTKYKKVYYRLLQVDQNQSYLYTDIKTVALIK